MADLPVNTVVNRASEIVQDTTHVRWPLAEKLGYITDAVREICLYKPDACAKTVTHPLAAGVRQTLPADCFALIAVLSNGNGEAVRPTARAQMDAIAPGWQTGAASATVRHWMFDPQDQNQILVYPPQPSVSPGSLVITYAAAPSEAIAGGSLTIKDVWLPVIVNYVLFRLYSKDAEYAGNAQLATAYYQAFNAQLVGRTSAEGAADPRSAA